MWQVLIVDDDRNFRFALRELIPWDRHDFCVAAEAVHGQQALEILSRQSIQMVLTDMEMPLMDGVELTKKIRALYPEIIIVAVSAFDDFAYVKESLKFGASDYILKQDLDPEAVMETLLRLRSEHRGPGQRELSREQSRDELYRFLIGKTDAIGEQNLYARHLTGSFLTVCVVEGAEDIRSVGEESDNAVIAGNIRLICYMKFSAGKWLFLFAFPEDAAGRAGNVLWNHVITRIRSIYSEQVEMGLPDGAGRLSELPSLFQKANTALSYYLYEPNTHVFHYLDIRGKEAVRELDYLFSAEKMATEVSSGDVGELLSLFRKEAGECYPSASAVDRSLVGILRRCRDAAGTPGNDGLYLGYYDSLRPLRTLEEKIRWVQETAAKIQQEEKAGYNGNNPLIRSAISYIGSHYGEDLSLKDLAAFVSLNENYFSNLFKPEIPQVLQ